MEVGIRWSTAVESRLKFVKFWHCVLRNEAGTVLFSGRNKVLWSQAGLGSDPGSSCCVRSLRPVESQLTSLSLCFSVHKAEVTVCAYQDYCEMREIVWRGLAQLLGQSRHLILLFFSFRGVWVPPKENTAKIIDACATDLAKIFSCPLGLVVKLFFWSWLFCYSRFTEGKLDKIVS